MPTALSACARLDGGHGDTQVREDSLGVEITQEGCSFVTTNALYMTHWVSTIVFALMMAVSGVLYLAEPRFKERFTHLGLPSYFRVELAILKLTGAAVLLLPFPDLLKEWAFAGFVIVLASAFIAHLASGDGLKKSMAPISVTVILALSYVTFRLLGHR